nr:MAG TPA: hypothetical protein [Caudoviricetes sp.]
MYREVLGNDLYTIYNEGSDFNDYLSNYTI